MKELIQFNRSDSLGYKRQECLREERFCTPLLLTTIPSYGKPLAWCPFLTEWLKLPADRKAIIDFSTSIDACINAILEVAKKHQSNSETEAQWMAVQLRACKTKTRREISKTNTALHDADHSKLNTLGSLCFLIRDYSRTCTEFIGTVYRGVQLSAAASQSYKQAVG